MYLSEVLKNAAQRGYADDVKASLTEDPRILSSTDELGNTLLHISCAARHVQVVEVILVTNKKEAQAIINRKNHIGDTALHKASFRGHDEVVKLLLKNGADPLITNNDGKTPLDLAKSEEVISILPHPKEEDIEIPSDED